MSLEGTAPIIGGDEPLVDWILSAGVGFRILPGKEAGDIDATVGERLGGDRALVEALLVAIVMLLRVRSDQDYLDLNWVFYCPFAHYQLFL